MGPAARSRGWRRRRGARNGLRDWAEPVAQNGADGEQRPRDRVLQEGRVQQRVEGEHGEPGRQERPRHQAPGGVASAEGPEAREQPPEGGHHDGHVREEADQALLRGDGDRRGVRGGRRLRRADLLPRAIALGEGPRTEPPDRSIGEHPEASLHQLHPAARRAVQGAVAAEVQRAVDRQHERTGRHERGRDRVADAAGIPAQRGQRGEPHQERREARLREREHEPRQQDGQRPGRQEDVAPAAGPEERRRDPDHHHRQEAPVDVRVEEQRVHAEVRLELVRLDDLAVPQELPARVLPEADRHEEQRERHGERGALEHQPSRPSDGGQQLEEQGERDVEEGDVLDGLLEVAGVEGLERVQDHEREQRQLEGAGGPFPPGRAGAVADDHAWVAARPPEAVGGVCHDPAGDHEVERDEQVGRGLSGLDRQPDGEGEHRQERHELRAAPEQRREEGDDRHPDDRRRHRAIRMVAQVAHLVRAPQLGEDQRGGQCDRDERGDRTVARQGERERARGGKRRGNYPEALQGAHGRDRRGQAYREMIDHALAVTAATWGDEASEPAQSGAPTRITVPRPRP